MYNTKFVQKLAFAYRNCPLSLETTRSLGQSSRGKYPYFWIYPNLLSGQCRTGGRKLRCQKTSSILSSVSIEFRLVTDRNRQTDTRQWLVSALAYRRAGKNDAIDLDSVKGKRAGDRAWWRWHRTDYSRIFARGMPCGYFLLSCAHRSQVTYSYTVQSRYLLLLWPLFAETTLISWTVDHCSHC